ncbi:5'-3' exonuclease H3TH domain-containing protein [Sporichthya sp.]|uniref:5'-3' exonuclease n=1 Tax=Sporichthya sp. TaxID=65475 RepID=UPI0017E1B2B0|nr:5'-3' exonuclease [Sporichthya sp.]
MVLDSASMYFRAFFGVPDTVRAPDGTPVNAVRGFLDFVAYLTKLRRPTHLVACMDYDWRPAFRVAAIPTYKTHRVAVPATNSRPAEEEVPDALEIQVPIITDVLDALGIVHLGIDGHEADDVIGTLATRADGSVDVVTGDRDLFQLVDDERRVRVLYIAKGIRNLEIVDEAAVTRKYGIPGRSYATFAGLRGDPSDGLPGVPGVGDKTAAALVSAHGDLPAILAAAEDPASGMSPAVRRKLREATAYLAVAPQVVQVVCDLPVPDFDCSLPAVPKDPEALLALADRWGLESPLNRLLNALAEVADR